VNETNENYCIIQLMHSIKGSINRKTLCTLRSLAHGAPSHSLTPRL